MVDVDVLIIGGGLVGSSLATALASHPLAKGLSIMLVDPDPPTINQWPPLSIRTSTITPSSKNFLDEIGVWGRIPEARIAQFDKMFVWDHPPPLPNGSDHTLGSGVSPAGTLLFDAADVGEEVLGYVTDNDTLRAGIYRSMEDLIKEGKDLRLVRGIVQAIDFGEEHKAEGKDEMPGGDDVVPWPVVRLENGDRVRCRLIAACDGSRSRVRTMAEADWFSKGYDQSAVVANVTLRDPITTAFQRFVSTGPVAVLPVCTEETAVPMGNVIWTTTKMEAEALRRADDAVFLNELNIVLKAHEESGMENVSDGDFVHGREGIGHDGRENVLLWDMMAKGLQVALPRLGLDSSGLQQSVMQPPDCTGVVGKRGMFPLALGHAPRYVIEEKRTVLVGDAAHSVHPLAGQGVNLGFSDVECLADCVASGAATGRDFGGELGAPLMRYQRERLLGNVGMMGVLHGLQRVFGFGGVRAVRDLRRAGMSAVNAASPVKRLILRAMR